MPGKSDLLLLVGVPALLLAVVGWNFAYQLPTEESLEAIRIGTSKMHDRNRALPDSPYLVDRARKISGKVTSEDGSPAAGSVEIYGVDDVIGWLALNRRQGAWGPGSPELVAQARVTLDRDGRYQITGPPLGNKLLILRDEAGSALLRYSDILVRDGFANGRLDFSIQGAGRSRCVLPAEDDQEDPIVEALPLYEGFWPTDWEPISLGTEAIEIAERDPDGLPRWMALRRASGDVELRLVSQGEGDELTASELWIPSEGIVHGGPELVASTETAVLFMMGFGSDPVLRMPGAFTADSVGSLVIQAFRGFSSCVIRSLGCEEVVEYTDEFGEFTMQLPEGFYMVSGVQRNTDRLLGPTRQVGVYLPRGADRRVELYPADEQRPSEPETAIVHGFVLDGNGLPIEGVDVTLSVIRGERARPKTETTNGSGFYFFRGMSRNSTVQVSVKRSKTSPCMRHESTLAIDESVWEFRADLQLPDRTLSIELPSNTSPNSRVLLHRKLDEVWRPVWADAVKDRRSWSIESALTGTYVASILADGEVVATSPELEIGDSDEESQIRADQWEEKP